jgi:putative transposase
MPDHLHLFISAPPSITPTEIVKTIKSITAVKIFKQYPNLEISKVLGIRVMEQRLLCWDSRDSNQ